MSHVVETIKIKRGAKMHVLANGAGRNLRSTIMNHLNIRIMKVKRILMALLKTIRDIVIISCICILLTAFTAFIKIFFGISAVYIVGALVIIFLILIITFSYYKEGGRK